MVFDMWETDPGYVDWKVREIFNGEEEHDKYIWAAYETAKWIYCEKSEYAWRPSTPKTALCGAIGACCNTLTNDLDATIAAFLCNPAIEHPENCSFGGIEGKFGWQAREYVEMVVNLSRISPADYSRTLMDGLPEEVLAIETARVSCGCFAATANYCYDAKYVEDRDFVRSGSLPCMVQSNNPSTEELQQYYGKSCILLDYISPEWQEMFIEARGDVAYWCSKVYDRSIWRLPL